MSMATLVSLQEYLDTTYHPDCDYVEGVLEERNVGHKEHSKLQGEIFGWFRDRRKRLRLMAFVEQRIQVAAGRYRIPDICVVRLPEPDEQIFSQAPLICIEVLSPDDSFHKLQDRLDDYLKMGVPNVWLLEPETRRGWRATREGLHEALDSVLRSEDGTVQMAIAELYLDGEE